MDGSQFHATWRQVSGDWLIQLEPVRPGGRLPPRGALLNVTVHRKDGSTKDLEVRVVAEARDGAGRARVALAERALRSRGPKPTLAQPGSRAKPQTIRSSYQPTRPSGGRRPAGRSSGRKSSWPFRLGRRK